MKCVPSAAELEVIAESYRFWRGKDLEHPPSAEAKKQIKDVKAAASKMLSAIERLGPRARHQLICRHGNGALLEATEVIAAVATSAELAADDIPKDFLNSAIRMAADSLRALFEHHGLDFSATCNEDYGGASLAVKSLFDICGRDLSLNAAQKWVAFAKKGFPVFREPVNEK